MSGTGFRRFVSDPCFLGGTVLGNLPCMRFIGMLLVFMWIVISVSPSYLAAFVRLFPNFKVRNMTDYPDFESSLGAPLITCYEEL
jgi:hypothetical protein